MPIPRKQELCLLYESLFIFVSKIHDNVTKMTVEKHICLYFCIVNS